jgi:hypothetical protein
MLGSSEISAGGRAVFGWFPRGERGLALGLRQTAVPAGAHREPVAGAAGGGRSARGRALCARRGDAGHVGGRGCVAARRRTPRIGGAAGAQCRARPVHLAAQLGIVAHDLGKVELTSLLVLYLYGDRGWSAADAALALGGVQWAPRWRARRRGAGLTCAASGSSRSAGWRPRRARCYIAAAALADAPDAIAVPVLWRAAWRP